MPMIVDPTAPQVTPPDRVVSPDGWLAAIVDEPWAGVVLSYNGRTPPSGQNLVLNPSIELGLDRTAQFGSGITRTRTTAQARVSLASLQHVHTGDTTAGSLWELDPVPAGQTAHVGLWVKIGDPSVFTRGLLHWMNGGSSMRSIELWPLAAPDPDGWSFVTGSYTIPTGQTCTHIGLSFKANLGTWWADRLMVATGSALPDYIDGDQPGCAWEGAPHASTSVRATTPPAVGDIVKVSIVRQDPGGGAPVPVRSADPAWAIGGVGTAYDHEAPLGVPVIYTATPIYTDGSTGPASSLAVTVPAPGPGPGDVWIKSVDEPGLSARVTVTAWPELTWGARIDSAAVQGSAYPVASQDVYGAPASTITIDAEGSQIEVLKRLLTTPGVRLVQTRPDYHRPDQYVLLGDVQQSLDSTPTESRSYQAALTQVDRPDTADQPLRIPGWSWDAVAERFATWDAVAASYSSWASLATNGAL
ncbi:hypothetical protein [Streptomyces sp. NPDC014685]|uniref:hypothetical protein n=1 Tax=Streptomyces sp. NPDC014685 TaxID=3364881 RepID=UPI0036F4D82D